MTWSRYKIGPFSFTVKGDSVFWSYQEPRGYSGRYLRASGRETHSLAARLGFALELATGDDGRALHFSEYTSDALATFARFFLSDIPGALHWAEHWQRVGLKHGARSW